MPARRSALRGGVTTASAWLSPFARHVGSSDRVLAAFLCEVSTEDDKGLDKGKEAWGVRNKPRLPTRSPIVLAFPPFGPTLNPIPTGPEAGARPPSPFFMRGFGFCYPFGFASTFSFTPITTEDTDAPSDGDKCPLPWQYSPERHAQQLL
ncbi:hypothetical protein B296_00006429 [Ensete ventricosum]|uniref:Uncharacterized protein n=1 Tax=Ensete ventricosum TaxID=4639 RepID=A0A427B753_ENSVE|nr:hypothetical protein B296_00006429 [Ensete ventricosum]